MSNGGGDGLDIELQVMGRMDHPNVLRVFGASTRDPRNRLLIMELCQCSLANLLYPKARRAGAGGQVAAVPQARLPLHVILKVRGRRRQDEGWMRGDVKQIAGQGLGFGSCAAAQASPAHQSQFF